MHIPIMTDGLRKTHLKKAHQVGLLEGGLPDYTDDHGGGYDDDGNDGGGDDDNTWWTHLTGRGLARPRLPGIVFARFNAASFAKW